MTNLADELERLAKEATPGEWRVTEPWNGFSSLKAGEKLVFGLAAGCDEERRPASECDANAALIVALRNALPEIVSALRGEADLKESVVAFAAPHAARYASEHGMAPGYLHPTHYDLLKRCGARMDDFTRAALPPPPTKGTSHE